MDSTAITDWWLVFRLSYNNFPLSLHALVEITSTAWLMLNSRYWSVKSYALSLTKRNATAPSRWTWNCCQYFDSQEMRCPPISVSQDNWHTWNQMTRLTMLFNIQHWNCYLSFPKTISRVGNHNGHQYLCLEERQWIHAIEIENND